MLLMLLCASGMQAQQIKAYVSGGLTFSQIEGDELRGFARHASTAGVGATTGLGERLRLAVEADFAMRGCYNDTGDPYSIKLPLNYVDVPLMIYYHDPYSDVDFGLGAIYGRLVQQPHNRIAFNSDYFAPDTSDMDFHKNDLALAAELRFRVAGRLYMSMRWQRSLISVKEWSFKDKDHEWTNRCYNSSVALRLQWQFGEQTALKKRGKK